MPATGAILSHTAATRRAISPTKNAGIETKNDEPTRKSEATRPLGWRAT